MSLIAELLQSSAVRPKQLVLNGQSVVTLGVGDLLKLPQGDHFQTVRQGNDLVVLIDAGGGAVAERLVVQGFFGAGSLGMVQIGPDGAAEMLTPRTVLALESTSTPWVAQAPQPLPAQDAASKLQAQVFSDLAINDTQANRLFDAAPSTANSEARMATMQELLPEALAAGLRLPEVIDFSTAGNTFQNLVAAPTFLTLTSGSWINAQHRQADAFVLQGQGVEGCSVEVRFQSLDRASSVVHTALVSGGRWQVQLSGADIAALGEGGLAVQAVHITGSGQIFSDAAELTLGIDTLAPLVPQITPPAVLADGLLNAHDLDGPSLNFSVLAEAGSTLVLTLTDVPGHTLQVQGVANATGLCLMNIKPVLAGLADGLVIYSVQSTDAAGNTRQSIEPNFNLRKTPPTSPVARLLADDDHGASNSDNITNVVTPRFEGVAPHASTVRVYRDNNGDGVASDLEWVASVTPAPGTFAFAFESANLGSNSGQQHFLFVSEDAYGNQSIPTAVDFLIDSRVNAPLLDTVAGNNRLSYTETLASTVAFSGSAEALATVSLTLTHGSTAIAYSTVADAGGQWLIPVWSNATGAANQARSLRFGFGNDFNGSIAAQVVQTDLAGNVSSTVSQDIYLRTQPVQQIDSLGFGVGELGTSDDTGLSNADGITQLNRFHLTGTGPADMVVRVYVDTNGNGNIDNSDRLLAELRTGADGTFTGLVPASDQGPLAQGHYKLVTVVYDELSDSTSTQTGIKTTLEVQVDTQVAHVSFDTVAGNDIVTSSEIADGFVTVSGQGEPLAQVNLTFSTGTIENSAYTAEVNATGAWSVRVSATDILTLGSTQVTLTATQTDLAGNASLLAYSPKKFFDIKLGALEVPKNLALEAADDTGSSSSDGITHQKTDLTLSGTAVAGYTVTLFSDRNGNGLLDTGEALGSTVAGANASFSVEVTLPEGANPLRVQASDAFGQTSGASGMYRLLVDSVALAPDSLQITSDNTINSQEAKSNLASIAGKAEGQSSVALQFFADGQLIFEKATATTLQGVWLVNLTQAEVEQLQNSGPTGTQAAQWYVKAQQTDLAGNISGWVQQSFVIDTSAANTAVATREADAQNYNQDVARPWRNASGSDPLTWSDIYSFEQGFAKPQTLRVAVALLAEVVVGDAITMSWGSKSVNHTVDSSDMDRGYALVGISGDVIASNRAGTVSIAATFIDAAGNASASFAVLNGINVTLEGTPPTLAPTLDSYSSYDNQSSTYYSRNSSASTEAASKVFTVTGQGTAGDAIVIFNDTNLDGAVQAGEILGTTTADALGNYHLDLSLAQGSYGLRAISTTQSDSIARPTDVQWVVVDVAPPLAPVLSSSTVSGNGQVGKLERDNGVSLSGTGEAYATLNVQLVNVTTGVTGKVYRDVTVDAQGHWSTLVKLVQWGEVGDGTISVRVSQTDRAGNTSANYTLADGSSEPQVVLDTRIAAPTLFQVTSDDIINASEAASGLVFRGGGEPGALLVLTFTGANGVVGPISITVDHDGLWHHTLDSTQLSTRLGNGQLTVTAYQVDVAENISEPATKAVLIDTSVLAPQIATVSGNDVIHAGERSLGVSVTGVGEVAATLRVEITGTSGETVTRDNVRTNQAGVWGIDLNPGEIDRMGQGQCTIVASQTDLAGNVSAVSTHTVRIATAPLNTPVVLNPVSDDDSVQLAEQTSGVSLSGSGPANTTLSMVLTGPLGQTHITLTIGADGAWTTPLSTEMLQSTLGAGTVQIKAYATNADLQSTALLDHSFTIELQEPSASVSRIATDNYVNASEATGPVVLNGGGTPGHLVQITLTGRLATLSPRDVAVDSDGKWTSSLTVGDLTALGNGAVTVALVQRASSAPDAAASIKTTAQFTIDTLALGAPSASDTAKANAYNNTQSDMAGGITVAEAADGVQVAVALPADAVAGDRMVLRWGSQEMTQVITAAMVAPQSERVITMTVAPGTLTNQGDGVFDISAVFTDIAGNVGSPQIISSALNVKAQPPAPVFNAVYADGYINSTEFTQIQAVGKAVVSGTAPDGGAVTLTLTGLNGRELVFAAIPVTGGAWRSEMTPEQLLYLGEGKIAAKAVYTSVSGADSQVADGSFVFDKAAPLTPASGSDHANRAAEANAINELAGGLIRNGATVTEAAQPVILNVALGPDVRSGDALTVFWGAQQITAGLTPADLSRGYAQVTVSPYIMSIEGDNAGLQVRAQVTDKAGNAGAPYLVWSGKVDAIPTTPEVAPIAGNNYLNIAKATAGWQVSGKGVNNATVVVTLIGTNLDASGAPVTLVSNEIPVLADSAGVPSWSLSLTQTQAQALGEGLIKVTSVQYDENRNPSDPGKNPSDPSIRYFTIDLTNPEAPTIDPVTPDNRVSFAEGQNGVTVSGKGESKAEVLVKIDHATAITLIKTATVVDGHWSVVLTKDELAARGGDLTVTASLNDAAGNLSTTTTGGFRYTTDAVPSPTIETVTGITGGTDTAFNVADLTALSEAEPFTVKGTGVAGNAVRLSAVTAGGGSLSYGLTVDTAGTWSKSFTLAELTALGQGKVQLSAVQIDGNRDESLTVDFNTGTLDHAFLIDTAPPALLTATITANGRNGNAKAGDVITVTVQASELLQLSGLDATHPPSTQIYLDSSARTALYSAALSTAVGADKLVFTYTVLANDSASTVSVSAVPLLNGTVLSDMAGNPCPPSIANVPSAILRVDTVAPSPPTITAVPAAVLGTLGDMVGDAPPTVINKINVQEATSGVKVQISLQNTGAQAGDTIELVWQAGSRVVTLSQQLSGTNVGAGVVEMTVDANRIGSFEGSVALTSRLTDGAGNTSAYSTAYTVLVDTEPPPMMSFGNWMGDNKINQAEAASGGAALTALGGSALEAGTTATATVRQDSKVISLAVTPGGSTGEWAVSADQMKTVVASLADGNFTVTVAQTDAAGNTGPSRTGTYYIDRIVPGRPTIVSVPQNEDGWINLRDAQTVGVSVVVSLLNTNAVAGDLLVLSGLSNDFRYQLSAADISASSANMSLPASAVLQAPGASPATSGSLRARIEDQGGNVSDMAVAFPVRVDTNILSPSVDATRGAAAGVSKMDSTSAVDFYGSGVEQGAQVSVYFTGVLGNTLLSTSTGEAGGSFKVTLQPNDLKDLGDGLVLYRVVQTDTALNTSADTLGSFDLRLSVAPPTLLTMTDDNVVNVSDIQNATASGGYDYRGLGLVGATVNVRFYVRDSYGVYKTTPEITAGPVTVDSYGYWTVRLSAAQFTTLSPNQQGSVQIKATQTEAGAPAGAPGFTSGETDLEFYIDRARPTLALTNPLKLFDGNGDGANKDGLLVTYSEAVSVDALTKTGVYTPSSGKTMGSDFRVEALDMKAVNGQFYATQFRLFLDTDSTLVQGNTISIAADSIIDSGGNKAVINQVLTIPNISVPGLPKPPLDIMVDNRINLDESSNVTRLSYSEVLSPAQLKSALGGLLQTTVNGVVVDAVIPKINFLNLDLTLKTAAKLNQGVAAGANVMVTFLDGSTKTITVYTTGTATTQATAQTQYHYTSLQVVEMSNISNISYSSADLSGFRSPNTVDTTGLASSNSGSRSGLKITSTGSGTSLSTTINLNLEFPNLVRQAVGSVSQATVYVYFTDVARWETVTLSSAAGTSSTASVGLTSLSYSATVNRPIGASNNFYPNGLPSNLTLDPNISVLTTGASAPVVTGQYDTSVVVKTDELPANAVMSTQLLDASLQPLSGTQRTLSYATSNPNQVLYTQSLADALSAAGRKLQLMVDGRAAGAATTMGISRLNMAFYFAWENQNGGGSGWGSDMVLQAASTVTARATVTFKSVGGVTPASVQVLLSTSGAQNVSNGYDFPLQFSGVFVDTNGNVIDPTKVASVVYTANSLSELNYNKVFSSVVISTSQFVDLPASAWDGLDEGLKQLTAQISTTDGTLTSVYSAPKQIRLDASVGGIKDVALLSDVNNNGVLDAGDTLQLHFAENVAFTFSALPASFGTNATVTPVGSEQGYAQIWNVKLGTGASIAAGQSFTLQAAKVFDAAGNSNATGPATSATIPLTVMTRAGAPIIDNVSDDNVITTTATPTAVKVNLTKAKAGDVVKLLMDGVEVGSQVVTTDGQSNLSFSVSGDKWGADGERILTTSIARDGLSVSSALRSVYVAADQSHWSQESSYAGKVNWFNPDAITQADGSTVLTWAASAGGLTVANTVVNSKTLKIVDVLTGHAYLVMDAGSVFLETKVGTGYLYQAPTMARGLTDLSNPSAGFTDFSMFKPTVQGSQSLMNHPVWRFTANPAAVSYVPTVGGTPVTVLPYTKFLRNNALSYSFSGTTSTVRLYDWRMWDVRMENVISVGAWQMVTDASSGYRMQFSNQLLANQSNIGYGNFVPTANDTLAAYDLQNTSIDSASRRFSIGGGMGVLGDQIDITVSTGLAYQQEIGAYLAAKFQSTGSVVGRNADATNTSYDLSVSNVPGTLIDQNLSLTDALSNDAVTTAGADYVTAGAGNDLVMIKDLSFRYIDGGTGRDTLVLGAGFTGPSKIFLSDYASNFRGLSGSSSDNARVNDAGFHRLLGFEKLDLVQEGEINNRRQVLTVGASDVNMSETNTLELVLGLEDVVKATGFANNLGVAGVYQVNDSWYDHKYTQTTNGQTSTLYSKGGDAMAEMVSFKTIAALNQLQLTFDHAMLNPVVAGDFNVVTYSGPTVGLVGSPVSINLRQGVSLTLSSALSAVAKITYTGAMADEAERSFGHTTWMLGTNGGDTINGGSLGAADQARGVTFLGGTGADSITGTSGSDLIIGGLGADVLTGGRGSDTFYYRNEISGSGASGGLGGTSGDVITDFTFNDVDPANNDRIDLSQLFEANFVGTGNAATDAQVLTLGTLTSNGGFLDLRKVTNFQTGKQDLQIWVDRDGGGLYGQLATLSDGGNNLPSQYPAVESSQALLTRLIEEGRLTVAHA